MKQEDFNLLKEKYEKSEFANIIHNVSGVYIPLNKNWKKIGISMSGGLDSALLCFILCTLIEKYDLDITIHVISHIRGWKYRPWQKVISLEVFNWFENKFPNIKKIRHEGFIPPDLEWKNNGPTLVKNDLGEMEFGDVLVMRSYAEFIGSQVKFDAFYNGTTKNPDDPNITMALESRNLTLSDIDKNFHYTIRKHPLGIIASTPFRFISKDWIVGRYKEFDIWNLFELTRSCEGDRLEFPEIFGNLDYTTYVPGTKVPECGKCFWCQERNWGVKNLF